MAAPAGARDPWTPPDHDGWVETASGRCMDLREPRPEDVAPEDIARHLSRICRFGGATRHWYSVAEHSVHVADILGLRDPRVRAWGLLHDAAEAYIGDCMRPVKGELGAPWHALERRLLHAVQAALVPAMVLPSAAGVRREVQRLVKAADDALLRRETRLLMPRGGADWGRLLPDADPTCPAESWQLLYWGPARAEQEWLANWLEVEDRLRAERPPAPAAAHVSLAAERG